MQRSPEWFAARRGRATASRFADVLSRGRNGGESAARRAYRSQLVVERLTGQVAPGYENDAMRWGVEQEPIARAALELATGLSIEECDFIPHAEIAAGCSPDGLYGDHGGVEIKCPNTATHLEYLSRGAGCPAEYVAQVQGCLWITGRSEWLFASFDPRLPPKLRLYHSLVKRDEAYIETLEREVRAFVAEVDAEEARLRRIAE